MSHPNLAIAQLRAGYGLRVVLDEINLCLAPGEWFVLLGPNGCGKTTLLDCVVGRLAPASGTVAIAGHSLQQDSASAKGRLGYGCSPDSLPALLTGRQCFEVHAGAKGVAHIAADLLKLADDLKFTPYLESFVDTMSLGTRQKLAVLLSLVGDPDLIVLDEAFNGLDPASSLLLKRHLKTRLKERGATLLLATHALDIVEHYADRAALLLDGRLRREWQKSEIDQLRESRRGFDAALAENL